MSAELKTPYLDKLSEIVRAWPELISSDPVSTRGFIVSESQLAALVQAEVDAAIERCALECEEYESKLNSELSPVAYRCAVRVRALASTNKGGGAS